jgi:hypothetical protein
MQRHDGQPGWLRLAAVAALLALSACSSAANQAASSTSLPPTTVASITTQSPAPTSSAVAPTAPLTTVQPTTTGPVTKTVVATPTTLGPPSGRYTITKTKGTGNRDGKGALVVARKAGYDRAYLLAIAAQVRTKYRTAAGWTLEDINDDPVWTPGGCAGMPNVIVGQRYEVFMDAEYEPGQSYGSGIRMTVFDLKERTFASVLPSPNDVLYLGNAPRVVDDHTVDIMIAKGKPTENAGEVKDAPIYLRRVDLRTGDYREWPVTGLPEDLRTLGASQSSFYYVSIGPADSFRIVDGSAQYVQFSTNPDDRYVDAAVDGVQQKGKRNDDLLYVDLATGKERAALHSWRSPQPLGWRGSHLFVDAAREPNTGNVPGVYNTADTTWDWVFDDAAVPASFGDPGGVFVLGLVDNA